jgi:predicted transposase YdaD
MVASDKLFYWLFQTNPDRILELQPDLPAAACGWRFCAPVVKEREHRLDGWFQPPVDEPELPAVLMEAQMGPDPTFLRRLYAQSARLVEQETNLEHWRVVVICPNRCLNFGRPTAVAEFVRERVRFV